MGGKVTHRGPVSIHWEPPDEWEPGAWWISVWGRTSEMSDLPEDCPRSEMLATARPLLVELREYTEILTFPDGSMIELGPITSDVDGYVITFTRTVRSDPAPSMAATYAEGEERRMNERAAAARRSTRSALTESR